MRKRKTVAILLAALLLSACTPKENLVDPTQETVTEESSIPETAEASTEGTTAEASVSEEATLPFGEEETKIAYDNETILYLIGVPDLNRRYVVSEDKDGKYLVCRSYSDQHLEFQFPEVLDESSYDQFQLDYQFVEADGADPGMTVLELSFTRGQEEYHLFDEYDNQGEARNCGIRIKDIPTGTETDNYLADEVIGSLSQMLES
ncbi:MAG: hypothetical protein ACLTKI_03875 [Lachnospiraceae bacterium]